MTTQVSEALPTTIAMSDPISRSRLARARRYTVFVILAALLQEIFWLAISRIIVEISGQHYYQIAPMNLFILILFLFFAVLLSGICLQLRYLVFPLAKIGLPRLARQLWFGTTIGANLLIPFFLDSSSRYTSGAMTGAAGLLYVFAHMLSFSVMVYLLRYQIERGVIGHKHFSWIFLGSMALGIDGLSSAMTLVIFVILLLGRLSLSRSIVILLVGAAVISVGFVAKLGDVSRIEELSSIFYWSVARFCIHAEQAFSYLSGYTTIQNTGDFVNLILRSMEMRVNLLMGNNIDTIYPRNVSEAMFFDLRGYYRGGSSPGLFATSLMTGLFAPITLLFYCFVLLQFFSRISQPLTILRIFLYASFFRFIFVDFSEILTLISPPTIYLVGLIFGSLVVLDNKTKNSIN